MNNPTNTSANTSADRSAETVRIPQAWQLDYRRDPVVAVLFGADLFFYRSDDRYISVAHAIPGLRMQLSDDETLSGAVSAALQLQARTLLILPGAPQDFWWVRGWPQSLSGLLQQSGAGHLRWHALGGRDIGPHLSAVVFQQDSPARIITAYLLDTSNDPWGIGAHVAAVDEIERPTAAANAWLLAQWALEQRIEFSPSYTGLLAMRASMRRAVIQRPARFTVLPAEQRALFQRAPVAGTYFTWLSPDGGRARNNGYPLPQAHLWSYDRNWSFVSSARRVPIGPAHYARRYAGAPGVYLISAHAPEPDSGRLAPGWFQDSSGAYPAQVSHVWAWQPLIASALRDGWTVETHAGWAFEDSYDLRPWQDHLWAARRDVRHALRYARTIPAQAAAQAAETMIKRIGVTAIGRLNQRAGRVPRLLDTGGEDGAPLAGRWRDESVTLDAADLPSGDMLRPEWWNTIIAGANERLIHLLRSYAGLGVAGYVDAAYLLAETPEIESGPDKAGGWHVEAENLTIPGEALRSDVHTFVNATARARRSQAVRNAN